MSASTVSITANPTAASRRRPVVAGERRSNLELAAAEVGVSQTNGPAVSGGGANDANDRNERVAAATSRDLSHHSIRGEALLERSAMEMRRAANGTLANSTISPRRSRKSLTKSEKPRWQTILSIFAKNLVLLLFLVGLVQMIWGFARRSGDVNPFGLSEMEGRIAEVEILAKKTTNLIQAQVDIVDRKIDEQIGGLRKELKKEIEDRTGILEDEVKMVDARSQRLERLMGELKEVDWLSKGDVEKMLEELKKNVKSDGDDGTIWDDVRTYARDLVEKEIEKHAADGLGRADYALESGGAKVVKHSEPYIGGKGGNWFQRSGRNGVHDDALKMLRPSFGEPGQCFPLKGSSGFVQIKLRTAIIPEAITLEHVAKSVAYDRSSAPKDCRISGWLQGRDVNAVDAEKMFLLAEFTYDLERSSAQTFDVLDSVGPGIIDTVRFDFTSNHGSPSHTCIYRLRVHGHEPESVSVMPMP